MPATSAPPVPAPEAAAPSAPLSNRRRRKEARPSELTAAALALFVEKGFAATRLEDIAARAGVSKGTLYLYFTSKEALFTAVIEEGIVPTIVAGEQLLAQHQGDSLDLLRQLLLAWWAQIGGTHLAGVPKLIVSESANFPDVAEFYYEKVIKRGRALLGAALARGVARGEFRAVDIESCIDVLIAPLLMLAIWKVSTCFCGDSVDPQRFLTTHLELMAQGLVAKGTAA